jgi:hypothetical protein
VRFFASLRSAQNDTGMYIFLEQPKRMAQGEYWVDPECAAAELNV